MSKYSYAIADYNKIIQINPNNSIAYLNRGINYRYMSKYLEPLQDFKKCNSLLPNNPLCLINIADYFDRFNHRSDLA